jgi:hypothetical protein
MIKYSQHINNNKINNRINCYNEQSERNIMSSYDIVASYLVMTISKYTSVIRECVGGHFINFDITCSVKLR